MFLHNIFFLFNFTRLISGVVSKKHQTGKQEINFKWCFDQQKCKTLMVERQRQESTLSIDVVLIQLIAGLSSC